MLSSVADEVRKSWIKISSYMETVRIPSRKQNVLIASLLDTVWLNQRWHVEDGQVAEVAEVAAD